MRLGYGNNIWGGKGFLYPLSICQMSARVVERPGKKPVSDPGKASLTKLTLKWRPRIDF